jgi:hypothetical protein
MSFAKMKLIFRVLMNQDLLPITHSPPDVGAVGIEIPAKVKQPIGLDDAPSWIIRSANCALTLENVEPLTWLGFVLRSTGPARGPELAHHVNYGAAALQPLSEDIVEKVCPRERAKFFKDLGMPAKEIRGGPPRFLIIQRAALAIALR